MKSTHALLALLVGTLAVACSDVTHPKEDPDDPPPPAGVPTDAVRVPFEQLESVNTPISTIGDRRRLVLDNAADWVEFWNELQAVVIPAPPPPNIDFGRYIVIAATMGQQPSGGYAVELDEVFETDGTIFTIVVEVTPAPGCARPPVITAPAAAIRIDRVDSRIQFVEETRAASC